MVDISNSFRTIGVVVTIFRDLIPLPSQIKLLGPFLHHQHIVDDPMWYVDNEATDQVTADLANLNLRADYKGKENSDIW